MVFKPGVPQNGNDRSQNRRPADGFLLSVADKGCGQSGFGHRTGPRLNMEYLLVGAPQPVAEIEHFDGNPSPEPDRYQSAFLHPLPLERDSTFPDVVFTRRSGRIHGRNLK